MNFMVIRATILPGFAVHLAWKSSSLKGLFIRWGLAWYRVKYWHPYIVKSFGFIRAVAWDTCYRLSEICVGLHRTRYSKEFAKHSDILSS